MYFVYELVDPRTDVTGYIGITNNPNKRYYEHTDGKENKGRKYDWIQHLQEEQIQPKMNILEIVDDLNQARKQEKHWIQQCLSQGVQLTNHYLVNRSVQIKKNKVSETEIDPDFLSTQEVLEILNINRGRFQYMVRSGQIKKVILPGRKYGVYPKEQINRLAAAIEAAAELYTHEASTFEQATEADLPEIYAMVKGTGLIPTPIEIMRAWIQHNPKSFYTLRDEGIVVAYACILAVDHDWLMCVLKDEIRIGKVPLGSIYLFVPDQPLDIYIRDLVVGKGQRDKAVHYAQRIIAELVNVFSRLGERGVEIRAVYAFATTPQGNNICQRLHFAALPELNPQIKGEMPYKLDIATTSSPLIDLYKKSFERYQTHHPSKQE